MERMREKHKLTFIDDVTYLEKWSFKVSALGLWTLLGLYTIVILVLMFLIIRYTGLSGLFGQNVPTDTQSQVEETSRQLDSLSQRTSSTQKYLDDLQKILTDAPFNDSVYRPKADTSSQSYVPDFSKVKEDSILRKKVESQGTPEEAGPIANYDFFFPPVSGTVSKSWNPSKNHFGVDVVTSSDEAVKSCLDGTVIITGWLASEGNIIIVQHSNELISVYKHCSFVIKREGEQVQAGDPLGIVGNSGENSSGPHLHFELWKRGKVINPEEFISF